MAALDYEPFDPRFRDNPERHYATLRAEAGVYRSPRGYWVISKFNDVQAVYGNPATFSSAIVGKEAMTQGQPGGAALPAELTDGMLVDLAELVATPSIVSTDDPKHAQLRRIVDRAFMPKRLAQWDDYIAAAVAEYSAKIETGRPWDVVSQLAMPLPVAVISRILGVEQQRSGDIKRWSDVIITTGQGVERGTPQAQLKMLGMLRDFSNYFAPKIEARRLNPQDDMISDLVRAEEKETLSNLDTLIFIMSLMVAGNETTTNLIGNTIVLLLEHPDQLAKVQAQPALLKNAIEETLRYRSPVQFSIRSPVVDVELGGQTIRKDEPMVLVIGSANRDDGKYSDPERFDVTRDTARAHFAFGHGIHFCIGFHLARREASIALGAIVSRLHEWKLPDAPLKRIDSNLVYGYQSIPLIPR